MNKRTLNKEQDEHLRSIAKGKSVKECTNELNKHFNTSFTEGQIRSYKSNHKIKSGLKPWEFVDYKEQKLTTKEQEKFIADNCEGLLCAELTSLVNDKFNTNFTVEQMKGIKSRNGFKSGIDCSFDKGNVPANKGKKMSKELYEKAKPTMFKKGNIPFNVDPIGTEKLLSDGYVWIKVDNQPKVPKKVNWRPKHVKVWQDAHGPVPEGHFVIFLDGNRDNFDLSNLKMISKSVNVRLNQGKLRYFDKEATEAGVAVAELIAAVGKAHKRKKRMAK